MEYVVDIDYAVSRNGITIPAHERAQLSDEHASSSYGIPVLVWKGQAYGVRDLPPDIKITVVWKKARTGPVWSLIQRAMDANYPITIDPIG